MTIPREYRSRILGEDKFTPCIVKEDSLEKMHLNRVNIDFCRFVVSQGYYTLDTNWRSSRIEQTNCHLDVCMAICPLSWERMPIPDWCR